MRTGGQALSRGGSSSTVRRAIWKLKIFRLPSDSSKDTVSPHKHDFPGLRASPQGIENLGRQLLDLRRPVP